MYNEALAGALNADRERFYAQRERERAQREVLAERAASTAAQGMNVAASLQADASSDEGTGTPLARRIRAGQARRRGRAVGVATR